MVTIPQTTDDSLLVEKYKAVLNFITTKSWEVNDVTQPISEINGYLRKQTAVYVVCYLFVLTISQCW